MVTSCLILAAIVLTGTSPPPVAVVREGRTLKICRIDVNGGKVELHRIASQPLDTEETYSFVESSTLGVAVQTTAPFRSKTTLYRYSTSKEAEVVATFSNKGQAVMGWKTPDVLALYGDGIGVWTLQLRDIRVEPVGSPDPRSFCSAGRWKLAETAVKQLEQLQIGPALGQESSGSFRPGFFYREQGNANHAVSGDGSVIIANARIDGHDALLLLTRASGWQPIELTRESPFRVCIWEDLVLVITQSRELRECHVFSQRDGHEIGVFEALDVG